jgi:hypothetical protein
LVQVRLSRPVISPSARSGKMILRRVARKPVSDQAGA